MTSAWHIASSTHLVDCTLQGFRSAEEVQRFSDMMDEMCYLVATKHSGSLKVRQPPQQCISLHVTLLKL